MATFRPRHISRYIDRLLCGELVAEMDALCIGLLIRARYHLYTIESGFSQECAKQCYPSSWVGRSDAKFENNGLLLSIDANAVGGYAYPYCESKRVHGHSTRADAALLFFFLRTGRASGRGIINIYCPLATAARSVFS